MLAQLLPIIKLWTVLSPSADLWRSYVLASLVSLGQIAFRFALLGYNLVKVFMTDVVSSIGTLDPVGGAVG